MGTVPKIVSENPYRILGVYANAAKKDIVANKGRATAFLRVNKPVEFPLDLKGLMPVPDRTLELMNEAEAHLAIAKEQIKYAQFWFLKMTPIDDVAFNHLVAGNMAQAKELWSKQESLSSLQNKLVCYLIEGMPELALRTAEKLYAKFGDAYISKVDANCTLQMSGTELLHQFIDSLGEEVGMQELLGYELGAETKAYISSQAVGPLINQISTEVEKAKKVDHKDPTVRKNAGQKLMVATKEPLQQLKDILTVGDSQYQMIADKLGLEILQCGIDYFNNSEDDDAPHTTMKLQMYALSVVVGTLARQRCEENLKILVGIIERLPPKEVAKEMRVIEQAIGKFAKGRERDPENFLVDLDKYAFTPVYTLLRETETPLDRMREVLGEDNELYVKTSTAIARISLNKIIEVVNNAQGFHQTFAYGRTEHLKAVIITAWDLILKIGDMYVTEDFSSYYRTNRNTLKSMCNQMGISTYVSRSTTSSRPVSRPTTQASPSTVYEREYGNASAGDSLWEHLKSPESSKWQAATIVTILGGLIGYLIYYNNPGTIAVDEKWNYIGWGAGIGAIAWFCILYDNDDRSFDARGFDRGGCVGALLLIGLIIFYWIYKVMRLAIDGIKGA